MTMTENSAIYYRVENKIGILEFDQPDSKVNVLNSSVMQQLGGLIDKIAADSSLKALLVLSKKKDIFIAGADIKEIEGITRREDGEEKSRAGQIILNKIEDLKIPVIAVIDGVALGGGCELALACHYRVGTFNDKVAIGLPEVKLGFVPGFAGTYRLPKIVGLTQALKMIMAGKILTSKEALKVGLFDKLFPQKSLSAEVDAFVESVCQKEKLPRLKRRIKPKFPESFLEGTFLGRRIIFRASYKSALETTKGFYPAPLKALWVIEKAHGLKRAQALDIEAKAFSELAITDVSKNLVKLFYLTEKFKKFTAPGTENIRPATINKCAVLGAGVMGGGIAQLLADKGIWARLKDINYDAIAKGFKAARKIFDQSVKRRKIKQSEADVKMARITSTLDFSGFKTTDMVIEAVVENLDVKKKVFKELSDKVSPQTILCTNTSALSVTEMAKETKDPSKVIGLHFFNPVHRMPLLEIIRTDLTSNETIATTIAFAKRLGKTPILVKDSCGFLVNRILLGYINEAGRILEEGGSVEAIDRIMTDFGMPMGPFLLSDEVGLDVGVKVLHILENGLGARFKPVETFQKVYQKGFLGKKSGKGFYLYKKDRVPNPEISKLCVVKSPGGEKGSKKEYLNRMVYIMINEAARCLEDGIVDGVDTVDIGMIMGTGFPPFRGGLMHYAKSIGMGNVISELSRLADKFKDDRFNPSPYLKRLA